MGKEERETLKYKMEDKGGRNYLTSNSNFKMSYFQTSYIKYEAFNNQIEDIFGN